MLKHWGAQTTNLRSPFGMQIDIRNGTRNSKVRKAEMKWISLPMFWLPTMIWYLSENVHNSHKNPPKQTRKGQKRRNDTEKYQHGKRNSKINGQNTSSRFLGSWQSFLSHQHRRPGRKPKNQFWLERRGAKPNTWKKLSTSVLKEWLCGVFGNLFVFLPGFCNLCCFWPLPLLQCHCYRFPFCGLMFRSSVDGFLCRLVATVGSLRGLHCETIILIRLLANQWTTEAIVYPAKSSKRSSKWLCNTSWDSRCSEK